MRLAHRSGVRWGELIALNAGDIDFATRVVHVRRAVEQASSGPPALKLPKNNRTRTTIFPKSLVDELAERMGTTQSVISRLEEGGGARNRLDTLARVATALDRHLIVSFPEKVPARLRDGIQVA